VLVGVELRKVLLEEGNKALVHTFLRLLELIDQLLDLFSLKPLEALLLRSDCKLLGFPALDGIIWDLQLVPQLPLEICYPLTFKDPSPMLKLPIQS
jgi:hypothetical protein